MLHLQRKRHPGEGASGLDYLLPIAFASVVL
jgi:hypothetical protein